MADSQPTQRIETQPLPPVVDGAESNRDALGRFRNGNKAARGNPHAKKVHALRTALFSAVTRADMRAVAKALVTQARGGDLDAIELLLSRLLGKPSETSVEDRLTELEILAGRLAHEQRA